MSVRQHVGQSASGRPDLPSRTPLSCRRRGYKAKIVQLRQQLNMTIEFASPGDFMPLPARCETRSEFIRHYGQVDAFAFDWYCVALSQVRRASRLDVADRRLPVRQGFVDI